jgi:hypothetical protein
MHSNFADWYNSVSLRPDEKTLEARWKTVEQLVKRLKPTAVPEVVRIFFGLPAADSYRDEIRALANEDDKTYITTDDANELRVLAGAVIAATVANSSYEADAVALAVSCADAQGMRKSNRIQAVVDATSKYLAEESVRTRGVKIDAKASDLDGPALTALLSTKAGVSISDANSVWTATDAIFKELLTLHSKHADSIADVLNQMFRTEKEQSDILWWIVSEHTLDGTKPFSELEIPQACYWGALDLNNLTLFLPGPLGGPAFLHKMLRCVKSKLPASVKVSECVDDCELDWKKKWLEKITTPVLPDLCPMLFALTKSVEAGGAKTWTAAYATGTGLSESSKADPVRLATQVYGELLLLRALTAKG